ncbi:MAG: DUF58 domain-containing protein [Pirellulales bacterium]|nr:DUF58 domain-containing protein [Pirellulales bacterium]
MAKKRLLRPRTTSICRETWYYLVVLGAVLGGAMMREVNLLFVLAGMLVGPLLINWRIVVVSLRGIDVQRKLPQGICAGDLLVVNVALASPKRRRGLWAMVVQDQIAQSGEETLRPVVYFPYVPPGKSAEGVYRGRLTRRGPYEVGPFRVTTRFPFGLVRQTVTVGQTETLIVYPRLGRIAQGWMTRHRESFEGAQRRLQRHGRTQGEFFGVRPWRDGDSRRSIHWRSSARRGELVVRQFEQPHQRDVAVLVDLWQPSKPTDEDADRLELAVSFAATVVSDLCRRGGAELFLATTAAPSTPLSGPVSSALMHEAMQHLAVAQPERHDRLADLLAQTLDQLEPDTETFLVSPRSIDLTDPALTGPLTTDPARAALLHRIRTVSTSDPELSAYFRVEEVGGASGSSSGPPHAHA